MSQTSKKAPTPPPGPPAEPKLPTADQMGINAWTAHSIFDRKDERKVGRALIVSFTGHTIFFLLLLFAAWKGAQKVVEHEDKIDVVVLQAPGPSGGGGGSPTPAPQQKLEIPKPTPVTPVPAPVPVPVDPTVNANVTTLDQLIQANGLSALDLAAFGSGGTGHGIGTGNGDGIGPGSGGGFGGGVFRGGNGCSDVVPIKKVDPIYTSEAMRAKIQGDVWVDAVVLKTGVVSDVKVSKSLDKSFGLDEAALKAAKSWLFKPAVCKGVATDELVTLQISFHLH
jgi:protein TonB